MEIISYIGQQPSHKNIFRVTKKNTKPLELPRKRRTVHVKKNTTFSINKNKTPALVTSGKVKRKITVRNILSFLGKVLSGILSFITGYYKELIVAAIVIAITIFTANKLSSKTAYSISHTGPLVLNAEDSVDEATLNEIMAQFANENYASFDEFGNLLDVELAALTSSVTILEPISYQSYKVQSGDTIDKIARKFGLKNISTLISVNDISNVRQLQAGKKIKIPSMDGIVYTVKGGDTINQIVKQYNIKLETFLDVNELSSETLSAGQVLFIPGAALDKDTLRNAMGELFQIPIKASFRWTSPFGKRIDPIKGIQSNHTGTDMACPTGTPIYASRSGTVSFTGVSAVFGKYVIINHGNGYQTLYAHMSKILATKGQSVDQTTKIGLVGSTGYSTGPHLHFTVYKNGKLVDPMSVLKK